MLLVCRTPIFCFSTRKWSMDIQKEKKSPRNQSSGTSPELEMCPEKWEKYGLFDT